MPAAAAPPRPAALESAPAGPRAVALRLLADDMLARRAAGGDQQAFATIYERYHQRLYRYCRSILRDHEDASDALQNAMINALRAMPKRQPGPLKPWLFRIAHNESISVLRRRRPHEDIEAAAEREALAVGEDPATTERLRQTMADMADLPIRQRGALLMRELNGLEYQEIADAFGVSAAAAKQTVYEARTALHEHVRGRNLECGFVRETLSGGDGRQLRSRRMGAHLRDCHDCRDFKAALDVRPRALAALAPALPAAAGAAMLEELLGTTGPAEAATAGAGGGSSAALGAGTSVGSEAPTVVSAALTSAGGSSGAGASGLLTAAGQAIAGSVVVKATVATAAALAVGAGSYAVTDRALYERNAERAKPLTRPASTAPIGAVAGESASGGPAIPAGESPSTGSGTGGAARDDSGEALSGGASSGAMQAPGVSGGAPSGAPLGDRAPATGATPALPDAGSTGIERPSTPSPTDRTPAVPNGAPKATPTPPANAPGSSVPGAPRTPTVPGPAAPRTPQVPTVPTLPRENPAGAVKGGPNLPSLP